MNIVYNCWILFKILVEEIRKKLLSVDDSTVDLHSWQNMPKLFGNVCCVWMLFECWAVGDLQFWIDICLAADPERAAEFVEIYVANANSPKASEVEQWPASSGEANDSQRRLDEVLASTLTKTEISWISINKVISAKNGSSAHKYVETCTNQSRGFAKSHHSSASSATWVTLQGMCDGWVQFMDAWGLIPEPDLGGSRLCAIHVGFHDGWTSSTLLLMQFSIIPGSLWSDHSVPPWIENAYSNCWEWMALWGWRSCFSTARSWARRWTRILSHRSLNLNAGSKFQHASVKMLDSSDHRITAYAHARTHTYTYSLWYVPYSAAWRARACRQAWLCPILSILKFLWQCPQP